MKRMITGLAVVALAVGCSTVGGMKDQDAIRNAVLQQHAQQRVATMQAQTSGAAAKEVGIHIDSIDVAGDTASVVSTQRLAGADGAVTTVKQKQQYKKVGTAWQPEGPAETADASTGSKPKA